MPRGARQPFETACSKKENRCTASVKTNGWSKNGMQLMVLRASADPVFFKTFSSKI